MDSMHNSKAKAIYYNPRAYEITASLYFDAHIESQFLRFLSQNLWVLVLRTEDEQLISHVYHETLL